MKRFDRTLANRADAAPRREFSGPGPGGTEIEKRTIFDFVNDKESARLRKKYKDDIEKRERMMDRLAQGRLRMKTMPQPVCPNCCKKCPSYQPAKRLRAA